MSVQSLTNSILTRSFNEGVPVSPMKLQKLLYFVYRDYLQTCDKPLFSESFEAWPYGPVLPSVYSEFKSFGSQKITKYARDAQGNVFVVDEKNSPSVKSSLDRVWAQYKDYSGIDLSKMTHRDGTAWSKAWESGQSIIDVGDIRSEPT